jgi:hypothetical protein
MMIDTAAYLGPWPYRPIQGTMAGLGAMLRANGIQRALVSPLEGFFYTDPEPANERLLRRLSGKRRLFAAPVLNLRMAHWEDQMEALAGRAQVKAVRLAPGFHGYRAADAQEAAEAAAELGLALIVQLRVQDERSHPPMMKVQPVALDDVLALAAATPGARIIAAAARLGEISEQWAHIRQLKNLWLDISHLDGLDCIKRARDAAGARRLVFSTCWPFFYARSAVLKLEEAEIPPRQLDAIREANARAALALG